MKVPVKYKYILNWVGFFLEGTINNISFVVVGSAAKSLAEQFDTTKYLGAIPWCNVALGILVRMINTSLLEPTPFAARIWFNGLAIMAGALGLAACSLLPESTGLGGFALVLSAVLVIGGSSSLGESVFLCYLKHYPPPLVNSWSSGTGMAGVAGSLFYLALAAAVQLGGGGAALINGIAFLSMVPLALLYVFIYALVLRRGKGVEWVSAEAGSFGAPDAADAAEGAGNGTPPMSGSEESALSDLGDDGALIGGCGGGGGGGGDGDGAAAAPGGDRAAAALAWLLRTARRYMFALRLTWWLALNLGLVYVFEYVISVTFAAAVIGNRGSRDPEYPAPCSARICHEPAWLIRNSYAVLAFCYQFGVFLSRSSLAAVKVRRVEILTAIQAINFALWFWLAYYPSDNVLIMILLVPFMVFVGLMGGASYVNCFYLLLERKDIPESERELCVNLAAIAQTLGITFASFVMLGLNVSDTIESCDCEHLN